MRAAMLLVHRYLGLLLALFLVIAGITGSSSVALANRRWPIK